MKVLLENWKGTLGSIAAILVVILQIIQLLLSTEIEDTVGRKGESLLTISQRVDAIANKLDTLQHKVEDHHNEH